MLNPQTTTSVLRKNILLTPSLLNQSNRPRPSVATGLLRGLTRMWTFD